MTLPTAKHAGSSGADLLRGVAIAVVVCYHLFHYAAPDADWAGDFRDFGGTAYPHRWWLYPLTWGWAGVPLFFVISGFCIHLSWLRAAGGFDWANFYWRRFFRIYPCYLVALLLFADGYRAEYGSGPALGQFAAHALLAHNFFDETFYGINPSMWSIATEVQLYLLYPLFILARRRLGLGGALALLFAVGCVWRAACFAAAGVPPQIVTPAWTSPVVTWFDWGLGALVAERFAQGRRLFRRPALWAAFFAAAFAASTLVRPLYTFSFTLAACLSAVALDAALRVDWGRRIPGRAMLFVGLISYSIYLWHQPFISPVVFGVRDLTGLGAAAVLAYFALLTLGSWLSYLALERPGVRLGALLWRRFVARPPTSPIPPKGGLA